MGAGPSTNMQKQAFPVSVSQGGYRAGNGKRGLFKLGAKGPWRADFWRRAAQPWGTLSPRPPGIYRFLLAPAEVSRETRWGAHENQVGFERGPAA